jgi:hypothetical protein
MGSAIGSIFSNFAPACRLSSADGEALEATVAPQQKSFESQMAGFAAALKVQAAQVHKVSDKLRTKTPAPRVVAND